MSDTIANPPGERELRGATLCQILHWLASGRVDSQRLTQTTAMQSRNTARSLNAYTESDSRSRHRTGASFGSPPYCVERRSDVWTG